MRPEDIDAINRRIKVSRALKADGTIGNPKSKDENRAVPIPPQFWKRVAPLLRRNQMLVLDRRGERYSHDTIRTGWNAFKREVDILLGAEVDKDGYIIESVVAEDVVPYTLRHTYCTYLQNAGVPLNVARYLMGHSKIELTAKNYNNRRK